MFVVWLFLGRKKVQNRYTYYVLVNWVSTHLYCVHCFKVLLITPIWQSICLWRKNVLPQFFFSHCIQIRELSYLKNIFFKGAWSSAFYTQYQIVQLIHTFLEMKKIMAPFDFNCGQQRGWGENWLLFGFVVPLSFSIY